jgi:hypothetical protein
LSISASITAIVTILFAKPDHDGKKGAIQSAPLKKTVHVSRTAQTRPAQRSRRSRLLLHLAHTITRLSARALHLHLTRAVPGLITIALHLHLATHSAPLLAAHSAPLVAAHALHLPYHRRMIHLCGIA